MPGVCINTHHQAPLATPPDKSLLSFQHKQEQRDPRHRQSNRSGGPPATMLNLMWSSEEKVAAAVVKEEQQDTCSDDPGSPLMLSDLPESHDHFAGGHQQAAYGLALALAPDSFYYPESTGSPSPHLELLQPLPSFQQQQPADFPPVSVHELTAAALLDCSMALHSPDSSSSGGGGGQPVTLLPLPPPLHDSALRRRKRTNSGSSGSSGTSSTSKTVKRRRPPISQEELMNQRNQGKLKKL